MNKLFAGNHIVVVLINCLHQFAQIGGRGSQTKPKQSTIVEMKIEQFFGLKKQCERNSNIFVFEKIS